MSVASEHYSVKWIISVPNAVIGMKICKKMSFDCDKVLNRENEVLNHLVSFWFVIITVIFSPVLV